MLDTVLYRQHGNPPEVLEVIAADPASPGHGEVLVTRILAPINPADLNAIEGTYPIRPELPGVPGVEGTGVVAAVGPGVSGLELGSIVLFPHGFGSWREAGVLAADQLIPVPEGVPFQEAAMLKINPATAWRMLHDFVPPEPGAWVVQNAANSAVGRHVIAMARSVGLKTVNLVRRPELIDELTAAGADLVVIDDGNAIKEVAARTGSASIHLALNAVGGESATRLAGMLANGGTLVTYGAMSRQSMKIPNGLLIFKDLRFRGFWVSAWYRTTSREERDMMFQQLFEMARTGVIRTPVEHVYPVAEVREAVLHAMRGGRGGKIMLGHG